MSEPLPPLPRALEALIADERDAPAGDAAERARIRGAVYATLGVGAIAGAAGNASAAGSAAATTSIATKLVVLVVALGAIGGGAIALVHRGDEARPVAQVAAAPAAEPVAVAPAAAAPVEVAPAAPPLAAHAPRPLPRAAPRSQAQLLADAWLALPTDPAAALTLSERDALAHPTGPLAEERDALAILALHHLHRIDEARTRAAAFTARYPRSLHLPLLTRTLEAP